MKNTLRAAFLVSVLTLPMGGCALFPASTQATIGNITQAVQQATVQACGFLPTAASVAAIISALVPGGAAVEATVATTASQICQAVLPTKASGKLGAAPPTVAGVRVHGTWVR